MNDHSWIFSKLPNWLRWILSPIVSVLGGILAYLILFSIQFLINYITPSYGIKLDSWYGEIIKNLALFGCIFYMLFLVLPQKKAIITGIISLIISIGLIAMLIRNIYLYRETDSYLSVFAGLIILIFSLYLLVKSKKLDNEIDNVKPSISDKSKSLIH